MGQLNEWGNQLINQKNIDSALAVIILNTEIHPKVANTFDSLGVTYAVMKQFKQALSNYQKVLLLQPDNQTTTKQIKLIKGLMNN